MLFKILILNISLLLCTNIYAKGKSIGRVLKIVGKVQDKSGRTILEGDHIFVSTQLTTKVRSFTKVLMNDDTIFFLGPDSSFIFEKFKMKNKNERTAVYNILKGKLRSIFTRKSPKKSLEIKTPTVSMGIRGTEILTDVFINKNGSFETSIGLISGRIGVRKKVGKKEFQEVKLKAGEFIRGVSEKMSLRKSFVKRIPSKIFTKIKKGGWKNRESLFFKRSLDGKKQGIQRERSFDGKGKNFKLKERMEKDNKIKEKNFEVKKKGIKNRLRKQNIRKDKIETRKIKRQQVKKSLENCGTKEACKRLLRRYRTSK